MSKRKQSEAVEVVAAKEETMTENPKRDLLEAFLPEGLSRKNSSHILDGLSLLGSFLPEEVLRVQASAVLLILEQLSKIVEQQDKILEELRGLKTVLVSLPLSGLDESAHDDEGSERNQRRFGPIDEVYFRDLVMNHLGVKPDEQTVKMLMDLAGNSERLERAIIHTQRYMEKQPVESPVGFLIAKLRSWRQQDSEKWQRRRQSRW